MCQDYSHIYNNASYTDGRTPNSLLHQYGIQTIVMSGFDPKGDVFNLPVALADPKQTDWKLVYRDNKVVILMRQPPPEIAPMNTLEALNSSTSMTPAAFAPRSLGGMYLKIGVRERAQLWLGQHLSKYPNDPVALREFLQAGKGN